MHTQTKAPAQVFCRLAERLSLVQEVRAVDVGSQVAITEHEPIFIAVASQLLHRVIGIAAYTPAMRLVNHARERIHHDIQVG